MRKRELSRTIDAAWDALGYQARPDDTELADAIVSRAALWERQAEAAKRVTELRCRFLERELTEARRENAAFNEEVVGLWSQLEAARAEADRLGDQCAELEGLLAEVLREPHPETGELQLSTGLRHRIRQALG